MYYELYIDVFFAENFMMDYLLLLFTGRVLNLQRRKRQLLLGAFTGTLLSCLVMILPIRSSLFKQILFYFVINTVMLWIGLRPKEKKKLICSWIMLYVSGFLIGGIIDFLKQFFRWGSFFFLLAIVGYHMADWIWGVLTALAKRDSYICDVVINRGDKYVEIKALIDSGNTLRDKVTGKPVSVIDTEIADKLWGDDSLECIRYIAFRSIGKRGGVMPLLTADRMGVKGMEKDDIYWIHKPLLAVCEEKMLTEEYRMILNLDILIGGTKI